MAVGRETVAGEVDVVADALRTVAVVAHAVDLTREPRRGIPRRDNPDKTQFLIHIDLYVFMLSRSVLLLSP